MTITSAIISTNFPVLVSLPASFDYANASANGADLRFSLTTDHAAGFELDYYIETWVPGGISRVWVLAPALTAGGPDTVYLFYGQPTAADQSNRDAGFPVRFISTGSDSINGTMRARGGIGGSGSSTANDGGGGGAGGRIKRLYQNTHQSSATVQVTGGAGGVYGDNASGAAGTTFVGTTTVGEPTVSLGAPVAL